ncbi:hypothetical protein C1H84_16215 [Glutamicibacter soli]|uniref:Uncharacterized protein n=1 Tax=Glutamicibacter soli TaxID=453836 RepID=A0A365Y9I9_9MICC|nr:hypothetical protein [Glutamicibacter soli]RBL99228.1 hypothetical protein C1H84_16215 [Glutamicibacter soli]
MSLPDAGLLPTLASLLGRLGWTTTGGVPGKFEIWESPGTGDEIIFPLDPSRSDFERLLYTARRQLERYLGPEAKRYVELAALTSTHALEETQWKKESSYEAGLIAWPQGEQLYASAREMLVASAKAAKERRMYHGNASSHVARSFLSSCLMGQTQVGSFIITAHAPAARTFNFSEADDMRPVLPGLPAPASTSGEEIMNWFETALEATRTCLDSYRKDDDIRVFDSAVGEGLSFEFARALSTATRDTESAVSLIRPRPGVRSPEREFTFIPDEAPMLERVASHYAQAYEPEEVTLRGEVAVLQHESNTDDRIVRVITDSGGKYRKVRLRLSPDQYVKAIDAHRQALKLAFTGKVQREGNLNWVYSPRDVQVTEIQIEDVEGAEATSALEELQTSYPRPGLDPMF